MIVFGSRGSDLALCQSRMVAAALTAATGEEVRIDVIETRGDRILDKPLPLIGGKGLFTEELENALREGRIDAAVHSMKDLPVCDPQGLVIGAVPERRSPQDVLICAPDAIDLSAESVPIRSGCRVGTSSYRRRAALECLRPDLKFHDIRGNVPTRVDKVRRGDYDAVVLAAAGIDRLQLPLDGLERHELPVSWSTPAPAQGALAVQCRGDDARVLGLLAKLHNPAAAMCVNAERDVLFRLGGGCSMPLGVLATPQDPALGPSVRMQAAYYTNPEYALPQAAAVFVDVQGDDPMQMAADLAERWRSMVDAPLRGKDIIMLRPDGHSGSFDSALAVAGARLHNTAVTKVIPYEGVVVAADQLDDRALAFTSARAVDFFCAMLEDFELKGLAVYAGGPATAAAAERHGLRVRVAANGSGGELLAEHIASEEVPGGGVLFPCAEDRFPAFEDGLQRHGIEVTALPIYRTEPLADVVLPEVDNAIIVFTSPSAVRAFSLLPQRTAVHLAIGPSTAAAMADANVRCDGVIESPTAVALIQTCLELPDA